MRDFEQDGKNINFNASISMYDRTVGVGFGRGGSSTNTVTVGSIGVLFLPNTWNISLSYSAPIVQNRHSENDTYTRLGDGEKNLQVIDFYMKPLKNKYGSLGFGYRQTEGDASFGLNGDYFKYYNYPDDGYSNNYIAGSARYIDITKRYTLTYNIPSKDNWYDGFGMKYGYEKTNKVHNLYMEKNGLNAYGINGKTTQDLLHLVFKPDTTTNIMSVGIFKTLDEVKPGLSFKQLTYGKYKSDVKYYSYETNESKNTTSEGWETEIGIVYLKKFWQDKKFLIGIDVVNSESSEKTDKYEFSSIYMGLIF